MYTWFIAIAVCLRVGASLLTATKAQTSDVAILLAHAVRNPLDPEGHFDLGKHLQYSVGDEDAALQSYNTALSLLKEGDYVTFDIVGMLNDIGVLSNRRGLVQAAIDRPQAFLLKTYASCRIYY